MKIKRKGDLIRVALEPGEPFLESLLSLAEREKIETLDIQNGPLRIKGPLRLGFYDVGKKDFGHYMAFAGEYDVTTIGGNLARLETTGERSIHLHMNFSGPPDYIVRGGHVMVEKNDAANSNSRFRNDFTVSPLAEFNVLVQDGMNLHRAMIAGCPLPVLVPKTASRKPARKPR